MKPPIPRKVAQNIESRPARGAWIETSLKVCRILG